MTLFLRLLKTEIDAKGDALAEQVRAVNAGQPAPDAFAVEPAEFRTIPGAPFAYWASDTFLSLFATASKFESEGRKARVGLSTSDDFRFLRAVWEVPADSRATVRDETLNGMRWVIFSKGGIHSPYHSDLHLVLDWGSDGQALKDFIRSKGDSPSRSIRSEDLYFLPGLTWPLRGWKFAPFALPSGCIFGVRGYAIIAEEKELPLLLALLNATAFDCIFKVMLGREGFPEFVVGALQVLPFPATDEHEKARLANLGPEAHDLTRDFDRALETTHAFCIPALVQYRRESMQAGFEAAQAEAATARARLAAIQAEIDETVAGLYGLTPADYAEADADATPGEIESEPADDETDEDTEPEARGNLQTEVQNLLLWCLGCAFGRWDVRFVLDPTLLPKLQGPFDLLPVCPPGTLVGPDGLPAQKDSVVSEEWLRARPNVITLPDPSTLDASRSTIPDSAYPLRLAWDGLLPDDEDHPGDIVRRVREVLELLWGEKAESVEREACDILGVATLREYFRQPRRFFDFHIKRYSKSRRKAPIYWLLQSARKNYGLWLYYHRIDSDILFKALTQYAEPKLRLENIRLNDLRGQATASVAARDRRAVEKAIARQEALIAEMTEFRNELERVARLGLTLDFNDGVIISIASLHGLVPWKEAAKMWAELQQGKYEWSTMGKRMRERGMVRGR